MKRIVTALLCVALLTVFFVGCSEEDVVINDGTYRVEYEDFDATGYKDFVEITFEDGLVVSITADAVNSDGALKSQSEQMRDAMSTVNGTYPEKYYKDLINQYLENPSSDAIDIVAGATTTSNDFVELVKALEQAVREGTTETVVVKRK